MSSCSLKQNESQAREAIRAFWAGSSMGRPALAVRVNKSGYQPPPEANTGLSAKQHQHEVSRFVREAHISMDSCEYLAEAMPACRLSYGAGIALLPELLGADYTFQDGTAWVHEMPDIYDRPIFSFDAEHPTVRMLTRAMEASAAVVGTRGIVSPPVVGLDAQTCLSLLRGAERFFMDLIEQPETVSRCCRQITTMIRECWRYFEGVAKRLGYGEHFSWYQCMAEGTMEGVQCDAAVAISPAMFDEFVLPDLAAMTEQLNYSLYHLDGTAQVRFLDSLQKLPRLTGIQWNPEPGARNPLPWLNTFKEFRRRGWVLYLNQWDVGSVENAVAITRAFGPDGLFLDLPNFDSVEQAAEAIDTIQRAC